MAAVHGGRRDGQRRGSRDRARERQAQRPRCLPRASRLLIGERRYQLPQTTTKRSSGTRSSSPTSHASSRKVYSPARSRGPSGNAASRNSAQETGRVAVALARLEGEPLGLLARGRTESTQAPQLEQSRMRLVRRRPDREHHREAGPLEPQPAEVVVRRRVLERPLQRSVADQQLASASSPSGTCTASGTAPSSRRRRSRDSGVTATVRTCASGVFETSWIDRPRPPTRRTDAAG